MKKTAYFYTAIFIISVLAALTFRSAFANERPDTFSQSAMQTEVITLTNRAPEDVINTLRPFLENGGEIKAFENQLIIQSTPSNINSLKAIIAKLDVAATKLMITISNGHNKPSEIMAISPGGDVSFGQATNGSSSLEISTTRESDTQVSSIPVDNGNVAFIKTGVTIPMLQDQYAGSANYNSQWQANANGALGNFNGQGQAQGNARASEQSYEYKNLSNGFYAKPQVIGKEVKLELSTSNDQPSRTLNDPTQAAYTTFKAQTTITIPMSQWTYLGGNEVQDRPGSTTTYHTRSRDQSQKSLWIRIDPVPLQQ